MKQLGFFLNATFCLAVGLCLNACSGNPEQPAPTPEPGNNPEPGSENLFPAKLGDALPAWSEGTLDIHTISTGRGECSFFIMPDGTTMMIDAAGSLITHDVVAKDPDVSAEPLPARPSISVSSGTAIADYVKHFNPHGKTVDYWVCSHFDTDHMGNFPETYADLCPVSASIGKHPDGKFYLNGINEVGTLLDFKKIIDRGYTTPIDRSREKRFKDYIRFLDWTKTAKGTVYETAKAGHTDQLRLNHSPAAYSGFTIRVLCSGGYYWTGNGDDARFNLPQNADGSPDTDAIKMMSPKENIYSIAMMLKWGDFDFFTGGDLQYNNRGICSWLDSEAPLCDVVGKVEVMKANHHGNNNANSPELMEKLSPQTLLINTWRDGQPKPGALKDIVDASPYVDIFATGVSAEQKTKIAAYSQRFASYDGHIVVRVAANGTYKVFILDDSNQNYTVKAIHGPYKSK